MGYKKGHPFYGDLSKPNYFKKKHIPWNKGKSGYKIASYTHWLHKPGVEHPKPNLGNHIWKDKLHPLKGKVSPNKGRKASPETIKKLRESHMGQVPPNKGKGKGRVYLYYPNIFKNEEFRESIKRRDDYKCLCCGITEEENIMVFGKRLCLHHIDYDKTNCSKENLATVCRACNARANLNRDYWKLYYQEKLSYSYR